MMMKVAVSFAAASSLAWGSHDNGALAFVFAPCGVFTPRRQNRRRPQHPNLLRMVATDPTSAFEDSLLTAVAPSSSSEFSPSADVFVADAMMLEISSAGGSSSTAGAAAPQPTAPFPEDGGGDGTTVVVPGLEPREQRRRLSLPPQLVPLLQDPVLTGRALVVAASAIYGTNFATVKMLNAELPTSAAAALRFSLAAAAVLTALAMKEAGRGGGEFAAADTVDRADRGPASLLGFEVGIWYCFGYLFQAWGLHTVDASKSAFFNALAVLVVPLLDACFNKKKLGVTGLASMSMALAGVALIQVGPSLLSDAVATDFELFHGAGDWFCLAQALFFGVGYWRLEKASVQYPDQADVITAGQLVAVAAGSVAFFLVQEGVPSPDMLASWLTNPFIMKAALWTGLVSTALALYMETVALKVVSASELTVLMTSVSVFGSAFAYVTMNEVLPPIGMVGGALIMGGCALTATEGGEDKSMENSEF